MAQLRPRPRTVAVVDDTAATRTSGDRMVSVDREAASGIAQGTTGIATRSDRDRLAAIGYEQVRAAAVDAGRPPPSKRTERRWRQNGRIPHEAVAEMVRRRDTVARMGGVDRAGQALGRSDRAIRDWQTGRTQSLRADAAARLRRTQTRQVLADSNIDPRRARPVITFTADVHARSSGGGNYDYRSAKVFEFGSGLGNEDMPQSDVQDLAVSLAEGDTDRATAILEEHASTRWAAFEGYSDDEGFHFEGISNFEIKWE